MKKGIFLFLLSTLFLLMGFVQPKLKPDAPAKYVIQPGDTLWSIACRYLDQPWQWPDLYQINTDLSHNPHLLYPGDILILKFPEGRPKVTVLGRSVLKLTPSMREEPLDNPVPTIPYSEIKPFLKGMRIVDLQTLATAPYVLAIRGEEKMGATDTEIYVKNLDHPAEQDYYIYRQDKELVDPLSRQLLGYEAKYIGTARVLRYLPGKPAVLQLTSNQEEVMPGDKLSAIAPLTRFNDIFIREPRVKIEGQIIATITDEHQIAQHQIAVINRGTIEGLRIGDVLAIYRNGVLVPDPKEPDYKKYHKKHLIKLPNERIGEMIIFKLFNHAALGLIMDSKQEIVKLDHVTNP